MKRQIAALVLVALAATGCVGGPGPARPSATTPTVVPLDASITELNGIDSANLASVALLRHGAFTTGWIVELRGDQGQAYVITPVEHTPNYPPAVVTSATRSLSAVEVADFRAMLDSVGIWAWQEWAKANTASYAPGGYFSLRLTSAERQVEIDLGSGPGPSGWERFSAAMEALAEP